MKLSVAAVALAVSSSALASPCFLFFGCSAESDAPEVSATVSDAVSATANLPQFTRRPQIYASVSSFLDSIISDLYPSTETFTSETLPPFTEPTEGPGPVETPPIIEDPPFPTFEPPSAEPELPSEVPSEELPTPDLPIEDFPPMESESVPADAPDVSASASVSVGDDGETTTLF